MARIRPLVGICVFVVLLLLPGLVIAQTNTAPSVEARFAVDDAVQAPMEAHQMLLDFVPGAVAPLHQHGGPGYITMLSGELILSTDGDEHVYRAGDSFVEVPQSEYEGRNATNENARLMVTYLIPEGHAVTTYVQTPGANGAQAPPPEPIVQSVFSISDAPDRYQVVHQIIHFEPGTSSKVHHDTGQTFITVVQGELTARNANDEETLHRSDETLVEQPGLGFILGNSSEQPVEIVATLLLPAGVSETGWQRAGGLILLVVAAGAGIAGGLMLFRRRPVRA